MTGKAQFSNLGSKAIGSLGEQSKKYCLRPALLGDFPEVIIDETHFRRLAQSRRILVAAFDLEERYETILGNFAELEKDLLSQLVDDILRQATKTDGYQLIATTRSLLNRRVINLLTATRMYLDQTPANLSTLSPGVAADERFRAQCRVKYDDCFEYRFMEALRNHVQHSGTPSHFFERGARRVDEQNEYTQSIYALKDFLQKDGGFKARILSEMPERVNVGQACRIYLRCLSEIHATARLEVAYQVLEARQTIEAVRAKYADESGGPLLGLTAYEFQSDTIVDSVGLHLEWDDVRVWLTQRNQALTRLEERYAAGRHRT